MRCKVCASYPSVVALHAHRQRTPLIATIGGTRYREEVIADHEKHACHEAAVKAKRQQELRISDPLSVPLIAGLRHMEDLFRRLVPSCLMFIMMPKEGPFLHGAGRHEY